jgi:hypothetical protein
MSYADDGDLIRRTMHSHGVERRVALHACNGSRRLAGLRKWSRPTSPTTRLAAPLHPERPPSARAASSPGERRGSEALLAGLTG